MRERKKACYNYVLFFNVTVSFALETTISVGGGRFNRENSSRLTTRTESELNLTKLIISLCFKNQVAGRDENERVFKVSSLLLPAVDNQA